MQRIILLFIVFVLLCSSCIAEQNGLPSNKITYDGYILVGNGKMETTVIGPPLNDGICISHVIYLTPDSISIESLFRDNTSVEKVDFPILVNIERYSELMESIKDKKLEKLINREYGLFESDDILLFDREMEKSTKADGKYLFYKNIGEPYVSKRKMKTYWDDAEYSRENLNMDNEIIPIADKTNMQAATYYFFKTYFRTTIPTKEIVESIVQMLDQEAQKLLSISGNVDQYLKRGDIKLFESEGTKVVYCVDDAYGTFPNITVKISIPNEDNEDAIWYCAECESYNKGGRFCTKCGNNRPGYKVCIQCGYQPEKDTDMVFCPECGTKLE